MIKVQDAFSSFSVDDLDKAKDFYENTLGFSTEILEMGVMEVTLKEGKVMIYPKGEGHQPATFTVLNLMVENIEEAADELSEKGIEFEKYDNEYIKTNEKGIADDGKNPKIAWFKDPAGNILSIIEDNS